MRLALAASLVLLTLVPLSFSKAQTSATPYVFATVDAVETDHGYVSLAITGIVQGDAAPSRKVVQFLGGTYAERFDRLNNCERKALLAMAKPGQYLFQVHWPVDSLTTSCSLARVAP